MERDNSHFGDNVARLMGMHRMKVREAKQILGISPTAVSEWSLGKRNPQLRTMLRIAEFFEVPGEELVRSDFAKLLQLGGGDGARFERVEQKIARARRPLQPINDQ